MSYLINTLLNSLILCIVFHNFVSAQNPIKNAEKCPYSYFELPISSRATDSHVFYFKVRYKDDLFDACANVKQIARYYIKYNGMTDDIFMQSKIIDLIMHERTLVSEVPIDSLTHFSFSKGITEVDKIAEKGEDYFIDYFFSSDGQFRNKRMGSQASIVKYLQRWCILAGTNHETGYLTIYAKVVPVPAK